MSNYVGRASTDLAMQFLREGKVHECIECADRVIAANPDDALAYSILGAAYAQAGDHGMAIGAFEHALAAQKSARAHFNLARAYEESGRLQNALEQYQLAVQMDHTYRPPAEALNRLSKAGVTAAPSSGSAAQAAPEAHLLAGDDESEPPATTGPDPPPPAPAEATVAIPTMAATIQQPADQPQAPDLRSLEHRALDNEEKARRAQMEMTKAGLIYGVIAGPIGLMGGFFLLRVFSFGLGGVATTLIAGVVLGAIVGLWTGYTSGDEMSGAKLGALVGGLGLGGLALPHYSDMGFGVLIIVMLVGAFIGAIAGFFIGMMVSNSIGWD